MKTLMNKFALIYLLLSIAAAPSLRAQEATTESPAADTLAALPAEHFASQVQGDTLTVSKAQADSAYIRGDYASAIQSYELLLATGEAAMLYYNLGNCYYKTDDIARAILNYERALLLSPGNADIRANLEIARAKTVDKIVIIPDVFFVSWFKSLMNLLGSDAWARLGLTFFFLLLACAFLFFFSKRVSLKKTGFALGLCCLALSILSNVFAKVQKDKLVDRREAIVLTPSVTVRSTPAESGTSLFILHEGCKVGIKDDSMKAWKEISLDDGKVGWIPASSIETI